MHLGFGWNGIGYHRVICRDGRIRAWPPRLLDWRACQRL
jgi:hypothetical protein